MGRSRLEGNGDKKVVIIAQERSPGYVVFSPDDLRSIPEQYPVHLSMSFDQWLKDNPGIRIRETMPIVENGQTVILHVWFDQQ